jgi:hypothetical protein
MRETFSSMGFSEISRAAMASFAVALTAATAAYADDRAPRRREEEAVM